VSGVEVDVLRKPIRNAHLAVYPPNGRVRLAVPLSMTDDAIRLLVVSKLAGCNATAGSWRHRSAKHRGSS
jgi:predicted metal-dependent hydrolase